MSDSKTVGVPEVTVIVPLYNCEKYLRETLDSIKSQTFRNWEAVLVDDASTDGSAGIAADYASRDGRFHLLRQGVNQGAAKARNRALSESRGRFIAYLDSDDYWMPEKLSHQIEFMKANGIGACFTSYETVNEDGSHRNYVHVDKKVNYSRFLKKPPTCSHTVAFDTALVSKALLVMPDIKKRQDGATWLNVAKHYGPFIGLDEVLACNRKRADSLSSNKFSAMSYTWKMYTEIEKLPKPYAAYCLFWQLFHAVQKRIGRKAL